MYCKETNHSTAALNILVIGYGNTLRADDGAGPAVIEKLSTLLSRHDADSVRFISCAQLTPEMAADIAQAQRVIFVDASVALPAGHISIQETHEEHTNVLMGHHFTPGMLLAMAQRAFGARPRAWVAAIGCQATDVSDQLTPTVTAAVDQLAWHLLNGISLWINGNTFVPEVFTDAASAGLVRQQ